MDKVLPCKWYEDDSFSVVSMELDNIVIEEPMSELIFKRSTIYGAELNVFLEPLSIIFNLIQLTAKS